ncbi:MAG: hypothetical protein OEZ06_29120 [Myxococcales bacterium]|nr:hypothetical protein [Myxococcales bacterium]
MSIACSDGPTAPAPVGGEAVDTGGAAGTATAPSPAGSSVCNVVEIDGSQVIVREDNVVATFTKSDSIDSIVMLFGGMAVDFDDAVSTVSIMGLDQADALEAAMIYPDFYLCSSVGGDDQAIEAKIHQMDFVPASCQVHEAIVAALSQFRVNAGSGGDRTSLRLQGAMLQLDSAIVNGSGEDVTAHFAGLNFQLVTDVDQLTGQSVLEFGTAASGSN